MLIFSSLTLLAKCTLRAHNYHEQHHNPRATVAHTHT